MSYLRELLRGYDYGCRQPMPLELNEARRRLRDCSDAWDRGCLLASIATAIAEETLDPAT